MIFTAIIAALCAIASFIIEEITEIEFFMSVAKFCAVAVVVCLLIAAIRFVIDLFS